MQSLTGPATPRAPADHPALDRRALGEIRRETLRDTRMVAVVLIVAIVTVLAGLARSLS